MKIMIALFTIFMSFQTQAASKLVKGINELSMPAGSIVIKAKERKLYLLLGNQQAIQYTVAVPKSGKEWRGHTRIVSKHWKPAWNPPSEVKRDHPELPDLIPGGDPRNPMGSGAMMTDRTEIAIHGTTKKMRASMGTAASYGCIRMLNEDWEDLFKRVRVGTPILMTWD